MVGVTFSSDATLSDHSTWNQADWHALLKLLFLDWCTITSETLSDYGVVPPGVHQLSLGFLEQLHQLIQHVLKYVPILLFVAEICTYSATHFAQKSASKVYQGLHTSIQETTTKTLSVTAFHIINGYSPFPNSPAARRASPFWTSIRSMDSAILSLPFAHTTLFKTSFSLDNGILCLKIFVHSVV